MKNRRSIRLPEYDYSSPGFYFVTITTRDKLPIFGSLVDYAVQLNEFGRIAEDYWREIPTHFKYVELDEFIIMPNHVHGIIVIKDSPAGKTFWKKHQASRLNVGAQHAAPLRRDRLRVQPGSLGAIIRSYKSAVTNGINKLCDNANKEAVWQRNYYEYVIRDENDLDQIRSYIVNNSLK
jgi:REP element-mobilizing transposase RayT